METCARLIRAGQLQPAIAALHRNLEQAGGHAGAELLLADAYGKLGDLERAIAHAKRATELDSSNPRAHSLLAALFVKSGQNEAALAAFGHASQLDPGNAGIWANLGVMLHRTGRAQKARDAFDKAVSLAPDDPRLRAQLANANQLAGNHEAALEHYQAAIRLAPDNLDYRVALADAYRLGGAPDRAIELLEEALDHGGGSARLHEHLGYLHIATGDFQGAADHYRRALALEPGHVNALLGISRLADGLPVDQLRRSIKARLATGDLGAADRVALLFALAMVLDRNGEPHEAFRIFQEANERKRALLRYDLDHDRKRFRAIMAAFGSGETAKASREVGATSPTPIFIVGMPRSGSTLIEQMLACHPEVAAGGELPFVRHLVRDWPDGPGRGRAYPEGISQLEPNVLQHLGEIYLRKVRPLSRGKAWITDKMPFNFEHLGLVARILPFAKIIHCRRDPMDVCVSNYTTLFNGDAVPFSYDLEEVAGFLGLQEDLMAFWKDTLESPVLEVHYEQLVSNQEAETRRILAACGLRWDDRVLDFHKHARPVLTASSTQVRRPLDKTRVGKWRRFDSGLETLKRALESNR